MKTYEQCKDHAEYCEISQTTIETINNYVEHRLQPGSFTEAVLSNDLMGALGKADSYNRRTIHSICSYVYNEIPVSCHGSREKVKAWLDGSTGHRNAQL